jgi:hypothetical protein
MWVEKTCTYQGQGSVRLGLEHTEGVGFSQGEY